uniref:Uncharacterized protein n=1 Tax=Avena sativa TaxID=4498 RepID=A0ACD5X542_AVESA
MVSLKKTATGRVETSNSCLAHKAWLNIWDTDVPNKVRIHFWRLAKNGLAVGEELQRRNIKKGVICCACARLETVLHRFWKCPHSVFAWKKMMELTGATFSSPPDEFINHRDFQGWLMDWFSNLKTDERALACTLLYQLWLARNDSRDGRIIEDPRSIARRAVALVEEWDEVHSKPALVKSQVKEQWSLPADMWLKFNTDGAFLVSEGCGGGGVVVRDHTGRFVAGACHFFPTAIDPEGAEVLACKRALQLAKEMDCDKFILETDSANVAAKLKDEAKDLSSLGPIFEEVKTMIRDFLSCEVRAVRRTCNFVAHKLAREGCKNKICKTWFSEAPIC